MFMRWRYKTYYYSVMLLFSAYKQLYIYNVWNPIMFWYLSPCNLVEIAISENRTGGVRGGVGGAEGRFMACHLTSGRCHKLMAGFRYIADGSRLKGQPAQYRHYVNLWYIWKTSISDNGPTSFHWAIVGNWRDAIISKSVVVPIMGWRTF